MPNIWLEYNTWYSRIGTYQLKQFIALYHHSRENGQQGQRLSSLWGLRALFQVCRHVHTYYSHGLPQRAFNLEGDGWETEEKNMV